MRPPGPSPESLDLAQVVLSPDQSQEVLAMVEVVSEASRLYRRCNQLRQQSSLVAVDLHQHFKAGPDLQEHQTRVGMPIYLLTCAVFIFLLYFFRLFFFGMYVYFS